jgi:hypothetical protein
VVFDEANLVSAGLVPVLGLAERCGLAPLVRARLTLTAAGGVNAELKAVSLMAGMVAGADSIIDMDLLRHGGMGRLFTGVRARARSARSCARSPSGMSANSTPSPRSCWPGWRPGRRSARHRRGHVRRR